MDPSPQVEIAGCRGPNRDRESLPCKAGRADTCPQEGVISRAAASTKRLAAARFLPPASAIGPLFRFRFERIYHCRLDYELDVSNRATTRVLGGYYKSRRLIRIYVRDRELGVRPLEELFDTFLHEMAHHLEYTEPYSFSARSCGRIPGRMHSRLFWRILGELKFRWLQYQGQPRSYTDD
jgi:hypothetical protein